MSNSYRKNRMKPKIRVHAGEYVLGSTQGNRVRVVTDKYIIHITLDDKGEVDINRIRQTWNEDTEAA